MFIVYGALVDRYYACDAILINFTQTGDLSFHIDRKMFGMGQIRYFIQRKKYFALYYLSKFVKGGIV